MLNLILIIYLLGVVVNLFVFIYYLISDQTIEANKVRGLLFILSSWVVYLLLAINPTQRGHYR